MICLCIANMMIFNVPSFLPTFVEDNPSWEDDEVTEADIALITGIFAVGQIIFAALNSTLKNVMGTKNFIVLGFSLLTSTIIGLGFITHITDPTTFKMIAIILRFIMGAGDIIV